MRILDLKNLGFQWFGPKTLLVLCGVFVQGVPCVEPCMKAFFKKNLNQMNRSLLGDQINHFPDFVECLNCLLCFEDPVRSIDRLKSFLDLNKSKGIPFFSDGAKDIFIDLNDFHTFKQLVDNIFFLKRSPDCYEDFIAEYKKLLKFFDDKYKEMKKELSDAHKYGATPKIKVCKSHATSFSTPAELAQTLRKVNFLLYRYNIDHRDHKYDLLEIAQNKLQQLVADSNAAKHVSKQFSKICDDVASLLEECEVPKNRYYKIEDLYKRPEFFEPF
jgi:hypothetical protein